MKRLGEILVGAKAISEALRDRALAHRARTKGRFGTALLEVGGVSESLLLRALSVQRQVPPAAPEDLAAIRPDILRLVPAKLAGKLFVVPFKRVGRNVFLAMRDPQDLPAVDEIAFLTGLPITPHVALECRIMKALSDHYSIEIEPRYIELCEKIDAMKATAAKPAEPPPPPPPPPPDLERRGGPSAPPSVYQQRRSGEAQEAHDLVGSGDPWGSSDSSPLVQDSAIETETFAHRTRPLPPPPIVSEPAAPAASAAAAVPPPIPYPPPPAAVTVAPAPVVDEAALEAAALTTGVIERPRIPAIAVPVEAALAEKRPEEPAPGTTEEETPEAVDLVARLSRAETRDDIAEAVLDAALEHVRRAALFIAQKDRVIGWAARPEPPEGLREFSIPFSEPSVFSTLRNTEGFYVGPCPELPANMKTLAALGATGPSWIAVVPVTLKGKSVLFLFGESDAAGPPLSVPPLQRLATMTATALEIALLKNRLRHL